MKSKHRSATVRTNKLQYTPAAANWSITQPSTSTQQLGPCSSMSHTLSRHENNLDFHHSTAPVCFGQPLHPQHNWAVQQGVDFNVIRTPACLLPSHWTRSCGGALFTGFTAAACVGGPLALLKTAAERRAAHRYSAAQEPVQLARCKQHCWRMPPCSQHWRPQQQWCS